MITYDLGCQEVLFSLLTVSNRIFSVFANNLIKIEFHIRSVRDHRHDLEQNTNFHILQYVQFIQQELYIQQFLKPALENAY